VARYLDLSDIKANMGSFLMERGILERYSTKHPIKILLILRLPEISTCRNNPEKGINSIKVASDQLQS